MAAQLHTTTFYQYILPSGFWWGRNNYTGKKRLVPSYFSFFYFIIFTWLIQGINIGKKRYDKFPWWFMLLRTSLSFFLFWKQVLVQADSMASGGCQGLPLYSVLHVIHYPVYYTCFESYGTPTHCESTEILCPWAPRMVCANGTTINIFVHISNVPAEVSLSHRTSPAKHKFKGKIIKT